MIVKGACYLIRDGASISVWSDLWVPWIHGFKPIPKADSMRHTPLLVSQLFDASTHCWNSRLIYELFDEASAHAILKIPLHVSPMQDKLMWILDPKGRFFVKSAYKEAIAHEPGPNPSEGPWKKLWKARLPERLKMLL